MTRDVVLLTTSEVAELLRVHPSTVLRWCDEGLLTPVGPGRNKRFRRTEVEALIDTPPTAVAK